MKLKWKDFKSVDDLELLKVIKHGTEDWLRDLAFTEFVNRYYNFVSDYCQHKCSSHALNEQDTYGIIYEVFENAKKYCSYDQQKSRQRTIRTGIEAWLLRIASNKFSDYFNNEKTRQREQKNYLDFCSAYKASSFEYDYEIEPCSDDDKETEELETKKTIALQILSVLNEKERTVYLKDLEYKRFKEDYMDRDINKELAKTLCVKTDSIRKIRERYNKKLKKAITEFNKNHGK